MLRLTILAIALGTALAHSAQAAQQHPSATGEAVLMPTGLRLSGVTVTFTMPSEKPDRPTTGEARPMIAASDPAETPVQEWEVSD